jgi:hypothetical protein
MSTPEEKAGRSWIADRDGSLPWRSANGPGPTEEQVHREHAAALEATLFERGGTTDEVVLELESGRLRLRPAPR